MILLLHHKILYVLDTILYKEYQLIMSIYNKIRDKKLRYDVNREAAKITALSSGKIDKLNIL